MHPHLLEIEGAARLIRHSVSATRRLACAGDIPATRIGGRWRLWAPAVLERVIGADAVLALPALPEGWQEPGIVTGRELAELLGLSERSVTNLLAAGRIPGTKVGGGWRTYWPSILAKITAGQPLVEAPGNPDACPLDPVDPPDGVDLTDPVDSEAPEEGP
jgi:excisionase family DNA binding protein